MHVRQNERAGGRASEQASKLVCPRLAASSYLIDTRTCLPGARAHAHIHTRREKGGNLVSILVGILESRPVLVVFVIQVLHEVLEHVLCEVYV
jgi:hypothetical protein